MGRCRIGLVAAGAAPPPEQQPGKRARTVPSPATRLKRMLAGQPAVKRAARELLSGKQIADGTEVHVESVASLLAEAAR
ncbi:MAG TPA: hypothetical protein VJ890_00735 [Vineibacter sp.]|nr:hypothetical protein [Vineibacter sp.]